MTTHLAPWTFKASNSGTQNVVVDAEGRNIASYVPVRCGPLLAAGPTLLQRMNDIARVTEPGTEAHDIAADALLQWGATGDC